MSALAELSPADQPSIINSAAFAPVHNDDSIDYSLVSHHLTDEEALSPERLARLPLNFIRGIGKASAALAHHYRGGGTNLNWPQPERRTIPVDRHQRSLLVTEASPEAGVSQDEAVTDVLVPGLTEMDIGSALLLHTAMAEQNPDRRIVTLTIPGVSLLGRPLSIQEGLDRSLEETANENNGMLPWVTKDGPMNLIGTSLGSKVVTLMAGLNQATNRKSQLTVEHVKYIVPAVGAINVEEAERFREGDTSDKDLIDKATSDFFAHMPGDIVRMFLRYPEEVGECAAALGAYALDWRRLPNRLAAISGNLRGAQEGVEWEIIKQVATGHKLHILGAERDPLMQMQLDQYRAVKKIAPATIIRVVKGYGHALSVDAPGTVEHLSQMEQEEALAVAA